MEMEAAVTEMEVVRLIPMVVGSVGEFVVTLVCSKSKVHPVAACDEPTPRAAETTSTVAQVVENK